MNIRKTACLLALAAVLLCMTGCRESDESRYTRAKKLLGEGKYTEAAAAFDAVSSYEDAANLSRYARAVAAGENGDYSAALAGLQALGNYQDSPLLVTYYTGRQYESQGSQANWSPLIAAAEYYDMVALLRDSKERAENCRTAVYGEAVRLAGIGEYGQSIEMLGSILQYGDSEDLRDYYTACKLEKENRYGEAAAAFAKLEDYRDAAEQAEAVYARGYAKADALEKAGNLKEAHEIFVSLGEYSDAPERAAGT